MKNSKGGVRIPLDNLASIWPAALHGAKVGAVLHPASIGQNWRHASDILWDLSQGKTPVLRLSALFGPQHGYLGQTQDNMIEWQGFIHPRWGIPVYSLYGEHREPTPEMLKGLDALLVDMQDVGARYYTFIWTLYLCMKACEKVGIPVVVLDRPNPIGNAVEGPILNPEYRSFVGLHPIPVRHGKTIGELARQFQAEAFPRCELVVLALENHNPSDYFEASGLPWVLPSPNMPTVDTAVVYPGMCLFEATNVSEGRGTTRPFEIFGASWIEGSPFVAHLNSLQLPGVHFREAHFQPTFHKFKGELCAGAQIHVTDRQTFLPFRTAIEIIRHLREGYPNHFAWKPPPYEYEHDKLPIEILIGGPLASLFPPYV
jgi:uncharacterized protein YbbC (DUF1343 family)